MRKNDNYQHRMGFEALEDKRLLAGDVTVSVDDGNLLIRGDAASNGVAVTSGDAPGTYIVAGLPAGDGDTSINGVFDRAVVRGVTGGLRLGMGEGDDVANVFQAHVRGGVAVTAGLGNDHVNVGGPRSAASDANTIIQGGLSVDLGEGNDSLRVGGSLIGRGLEAEGGLGQDHVAIVGSRIRGAVGIGTGRGDDNVAIEGTHAVRVRVDAGAGADQVALVDSVFAGIAVDTGVGNDHMAIAGIRARHAAFQGGPGQDTLQFIGGSRFGHLRIDGFETVGGGGDVTTDSTIDGLSDYANFDRVK